MLLNVFLAIAVDNISLDDAEETVVEEEEAAREEHMAEVKEKYAPSNGSVYVISHTFTLKYSP